MEEVLNKYMEVIVYVKNVFIFSYLLCVGLCMCNIKKVQLSALNGRRKKTPPTL